MAIMQMSAGKAVRDFSINNILSLNHIKAERERGEEWREVTYKNKWLARLCSAEAHFDASGMYTK